MTSSQGIRSEDYVGFDRGATPLCASRQKILAEDSSLQAWSHVAAASTVAAANDCAGPLAGLPFGVKDVIDVAGMPTRSGSTASDDRLAAFDAACVSQLRHAGAIPIGKTVTAEYAFRAPGPTVNPHNPRHTPGGSSSGSAAAVAADMVPFALGTQTGGSIIRPAAFCGVIGFKPSFGAVQRGGMTLTCDSLDVIGWFGKSMPIMELVADVLLPYPPISAAVPAMRRAAVVLDTADHPLDGDAREALLGACDRLRKAGIDIREMPPFAYADELARLHTVIMEFELAHNLQPVADLQRDKLSDGLVSTIERGLRISRQDYTSARTAQQRLRMDWAAIVAADIDVVIAPSAPGAAPAGLASTGTSAFNKPWSLLGWPCLHLPTGSSRAGLPLGIQLVANYEDDRRLLNAAAAWQPLLAGA